MPDTDLDALALCFADSIARYFATAEALYAARVGRQRIAHRQMYRLRGARRTPRFCSRYRP